VTEETRTCGSCTLCCTLLSVQSLGKGMNEPCRHQGPGGCRIYAERPYACRMFDCLWLAGMGREDQRPDQIHVVATAWGTDLAVHEDPAHEGAGRAALADLIARVRSQGKRVAYWVGDEREEQGA
jgi:uncharacterized protein